MDITKKRMEYFLGLHSEIDNRLSTIRNIARQYKIQTGGDFSDITSIDMNKIEFEWDDYCRGQYLGKENGSIPTRLLWSSYEEIDEYFRAERKRLDDAAEAKKRDEEQARRDRDLKELARLQAQYPNS